MAEGGVFGFVLHPLSKADLCRKYPVFRFLPERAAEWVVSRMRPQVLSHVSGVRSPTGAEAEGWFVACPLLPRTLKNDEDRAIERVAEAVRLAEEQGAKIVGLGAFTAIIGDGGKAVQERVEVAVTTGNSYTVATAMEGTERACELMGKKLSESKAAVLGATGSIGRVCALLLAEKVPELVLIGRNRERLEEVAEEARARGEAKVEVSTDIESSLPEADVVITVTSALEEIVEPRHLKPGAVVCDVARPRDVSRKVAEERDDVLVIEGGLVEVPGEVELGFDFGLPPKTVYACIAEAMILALERRYEPFSLGRELSLERVSEIWQLARKHGFKLSALRSFERSLSEEEIAKVRERAEKKGRRG